MKRLISLLLAVCLLCTSAAAAFDRSDFDKVMDKLKESDAFSRLFDSQELKEKTAQLITRLREFTEEIKTMSDEELEQTIRDVAAEYNIPEMNEEQIRFLMDLCRSFESVEKFAATIKSYEDKINGLGDTLQKLSDNLDKILNRLGELLDTLNGILDKFLGEDEPATPLTA